MFELQSFKNGSLLRLLYKNKKLKIIAKYISEISTISSQTFNRLFKKENIFTTSSGNTLSSLRSSKFTTSKPRYLKTKHCAILPARGEATNHWGSQAGWQQFSALSTSSVSGPWLILTSEIECDYHDFLLRTVLFALKVLLEKKTNVRSLNWINLSDVYLLFHMNLEKLCTHLNPFSSIFGTIQPLNSYMCQGQWTPYSGEKLIDVFIPGINKPHYWGVDRPSPNTGNSNGSWSTTAQSWFF